MLISLSKDTNSANPKETRVSVKVSAADDYLAELVESHSFNLQEIQEGRSIAVDVFNLKPNSADLRKYSKRLFWALFSENESNPAWHLLQDMLRPLSKRRILLDLNGDHDLDIIPWEYAWGNNTPLSNNAELKNCGYLTNKCIFTRVYRRRIPQLSELQRLPLRIVAVVPDPIIPPSDPNAKQFPDLHLGDLFPVLCDEYEKNNRAVLLQRVFPPTIYQMYELLRGKPEMATVLHFMGHCGSQNNGAKALIFEDQDTGGLDFADALHIDATMNLRLAFLSACGTRHVARDLTENGIPYTIGSHCPLPEDLAHKFEHNFYHCLASGCTVEKAMLDARASMKDPKDIRQRDYFPGAMILYSSTFREEDGAFKCDSGKPTIEAHMPHHNLEEISYTRFLCGRKEKLIEIAHALRRMAKRGTQTCPMYTIEGITGQGKTALAEKAVRRMAYLFPGGIFAWRFDPSQEVSAIKYLQRLSQVLFQEDFGNDIDTLGQAIIMKFRRHPTTLLILNRADVLKRAQLKGDKDAITLVNWLRNVVSIQDIAVRILATSNQHLKWTVEEEMMHLDGLTNSDGSTESDIESGVELFIRNLDAQVRQRMENEENATQLLRDLVRLVDGHPLRLKSLSRAVSLPQYRNASLEELVHEHFNAMLVDGSHGDKALEQNETLTKLNLNEHESKADVAAESVSEVEGRNVEFVAEVESPIHRNDMVGVFEPNVDTKENKYEYVETGFHNWLNKAQPDEESNPDAAMFAKNLTRAKLNGVGASIKGAQLVDEEISSDRAAYSDSYPIANVAPAARAVPASYTEYVTFESETQGNKQPSELTAGAIKGKDPAIPYAIDEELNGTLELEEQEVVALSAADREGPIFQYGMGGAFELEQVDNIEDGVESATKKEHLILPFYVDGVFIKEEQESKETDAESSTEEECAILPYDVDGAFELEESKMEIVPESVNEGNGPIIPYDVDGTLGLEEYESKVEDALESVSEVEDLILLYDVGVGLELEQENKIEVVEMESPNLLYNVDSAFELNADTKKPLSKAGVPFYDWLEMSLPEEEKEDAELVELHQLGKKIAESINNKNRLVMLMPTHLLDDINWDTYSLGIRLYVRWRLNEHELQSVNEIVKKYGIVFKGVEQLVVVDVAVSESGGEGDKPSDGSNNDGENQIPEENQAESSRKQESNEGGDSRSGDAGPSDIGNLGEGSSFSNNGAEGAGRSPNTNGNNKEGRDDGGPSTVEESNSTQSEIAIWRQLLHSFCCCPCGVLRDRRIADVEENSRVDIQHNETMTPSIPPNPTDESLQRTAAAPGLHTSPLLSNPTDEAREIIVTSPIRPADSSNERTAATPGLHTSTEESDTHSNTSTCMPNIVNNNRETNVKGLNATGAIIRESNIHITNNNYTQSALMSEGQEDPKFTVEVLTSSKAILKNKKQDFTINFTLKITISKSSHKLELSEIFFEGGTQHLTLNERYILNNFCIKFSSGTGNASFRKIQPEEKAKDHWRINHGGCLGVYQWRHNIDDIRILSDLRHDLKPHSAEYKWNGVEPTEYSIDIRVNLLVVRNLTRDVMDIFRKDHDLVNRVSLRVNILSHDMEVIPHKTLQCTWKVAADVEHCEQESSLMNVPNEFIQLSSCTKRCCQLVTGIYAIKHLQCNNELCKALIKENYQDCITQLRHLS